jgi:hypothetical protein
MLISCAFIQEKAMVPIKSKLSYLWARASRKGHIYSHVLTDDRVSKYGPPKYSHWLSAIPVKGKKDQYQIYAETFTNETYTLRTHHETTKWSGTFTRAEVLKEIQEWEKLNEGGHYTPFLQPFRGSIKTPKFKKRALYGM